MLIHPIYLHIRFCRKFALKQKHNWISFSLYVMQNNSDVFNEHIAVGMLFRSQINTTYAY